MTPPYLPLFPYTTLFRSKATVIDRGVPIWQTRSTVPISIPSSSEAVATTARNSPFLRRSSAFSRSFRESDPRSEEHTSELQSHSDLVCRLLLEKKKKTKK